MKNIATIFVFILYVLALSACNHDLELVSAGKTDYVIVILCSPTMIEQRAAKELNEYLDKMTGIVLPVVEDNTAPAKYEISIGNTNRIIPLAISSDKLEQDGFYIRTEGRKLYIMGGNSYGTLYDVYELLEKYLGCRKYTPAIEVVPQRSTVVLPADIDDWQVPAITSRNMLYVCANDNAFFDWLRLTQTPASWVDRGKWGLWVHTFGTLVSPEKYFTRHPEYFAMNEKGERVPSQLCLSNPDLLDVLCKELDFRMSEKPEALYWSVSQNDNYNWFIQSILDRLFLPQGMEVYVSSDNWTYKPTGGVKNEMDRQKNYKTKVFGVCFTPCNARYIKIKVKVVPVCPMWHRDARSDAWTMLDEIAVR